MRKIVNNHKKELIPIIATSILYISTIASLLAILPYFKLLSTKIEIYQTIIILFISLLFLGSVYYLTKIIVESDEENKKKLFDLLERFDPHKKDVCYNRFVKKFDTALDVNGSNSTGIGFFSVTDYTLKKLTNDNIPDQIINKLQVIKNQTFKNRSDFLIKLEDIVGLEDTKKFGDEILNFTNEFICQLNESVSYGFKKKFKHTDIEALANVLTPEGVIEDYEARAQEIWIATTKLDKDVKEEYIMAGVEKNLDLGKKYVYFVPHTEDVQRNIILFTRKYEKYKNQYKFIIFPEEAIPLFEEIAIYNPTENEEVRRGLALSTIDDRSIGVYVRLSTLQVKRYVYKLGNLLENGYKIEVYFEDFKTKLSNKRISTNIQNRIFEVLTSETKKDCFLTRKRFDKLKKKLEPYKTEFSEVQDFLMRIEPLLYRDIDSIKREFLSIEEYDLIIKNAKSKESIDEAIQFIYSHIKHLIADKEIGGDYA